MSIFPNRRRIERRLKSIRANRECRKCSTTLVDGKCLVCLWSKEA